MYDEITGASGLIFPSTHVTTLLQLTLTYDLVLGCLRFLDCH